MTNCIDFHFLYRKINIMMIKRIDIQIILFYLFLIFLSLMLLMVVCNSLFIYECTMVPNLLIHWLIIL
jgi:hypothetical protein